MPDAKEISALTTAESTSASDLFETALPNAMMQTGYVSRKVTLNTIATFILNTLQFQALNTTVKNIIGAINELAQGSGQSLDTLNDVDIDDQTLTNGQSIVYDATAQKWKNGTVSGGGGHTYSTTEQVVGTWIDGSPVYEKTITISNLHTGAGSTDYLISQEELNVIDFSGAYNSGNYYRNFNAIIVTQGGQFDHNYEVAAQTVILNGSTYIRVGTVSNRDSINGYVTVRYTKSST